MHNQTVIHKGKIILPTNDKSDVQSKLNKFKSIQKSKDILSQMKQKDKLYQQQSIQKARLNTSQEEAQKEKPLEAIGRSSKDSSPMPSRVPHRYQKSHKSKFSKLFFRNSQNSRPSRIISRELFPKLDSDFSISRQVPGLGHD